MTRSLLLPLGLLPVLGFAQVTKAGGGYQFRAKLRKGQVISYSMTAMKTAGGGGPMKILSPFTLTVLGPEGSDYRVRASSGPVTMNGKEYQPKTSTEGLLDSRLRPVGGGDQAGAFTGMFPERSIAIGSSWTAPLAISTGNLPGNSVATYRFQKITTIDGQPVAVLQTTLAGMLKGSGVTLVRMSDGTPQRMTLTLGLTYTKGPQKETPMQLRFDVIRK